MLERFPKLKLVSAENDTGWLPHFMSVIAGLPIYWLLFLGAKENPRI